MRSAPPVAIVCRTVVVLTYLGALLAAGRPGWAAALAAPALLAVWLAPLLLAHGRHRSVQPAVAVALAQPGEATVG